jgi:hypothetical protein
MITALSAFALATPVFGLSLSIDLPALDLTLPTDVVLQIADAEGAADDADADDEADPTVAEQMAKRARFARMHRILGLSTFASMTVTVTLGTLQYANLYGFFAAREDTRCLRGNAFFGQDACSGTPVPHLVSAMVTSGLYYATFGLSYAMPDPVGLDQGDSRAARRLRQHKRLRWAHFSGMALQIVLGMFAANPQWLGIDRANDYRAMQALATVHLVSGFATYGTLTWAGALMAF